MSASALPTHLDLLAGVRQAQAVAAEADPLRLADTLRRLRTSFEAHIEAEGPFQVSLPGAVGEALANGQRRMLALVAGLEEEVRNGGGVPCIVRFAELAALLRRQAGLELRVSHQRGGTG